MIEIEKIEDFEPNIYDTMYNLAVDVMDKVSLNSSFFEQWDENKFIFLNVEELLKQDEIENRIMEFKQSSGNWDGPTEDKELIFVTSYKLSYPKIEKILPDSIVVFIEGKYKGDEKDLPRMKDKNIFYYGANPDRFIRYFGKFGLAINL